MKNVHASIVRVAAVLLVAFSAMGTLWSVQQYLIVGTLKESMQSVAALEESLVLAVKSSSSVPQKEDATFKSIEREAGQLKAVRLSIIEATSRAQRLYLVDIALWGVVFLLSSLAASHHVTWRKVER